MPPPLSPAGILNVRAGPDPCLDTCHSCPPYRKPWSRNAEMEAARLGLGWGSVGAVARDELGVCSGACPRSGELLTSSGPILCSEPVTSEKNLSATMQTRDRRDLVCCEPSVTGGPASLGRASGAEPLLTWAPFQGRTAWAMATPGLEDVQFGTGREGSLPVQVLLLKS